MTTVGGIVLLLFQIVNSGCAPAETAKSKTLDATKFRGTTPTPTEIARRQTAYEAAMQNMRGASSAPSAPDLAAKALAERQKKQGITSPRP